MQLLIAWLASLKEKGNYDKAIKIRLKVEYPGAL